MNPANGSGEFIDLAKPSHELFLLMNQANESGESICKLIWLNNPANESGR